jgi:hypothetical protein
MGRKSTRTPPSYSHPRSSRPFSRWGVMPICALLAGILAVGHAQRVVRAAMAAGMVPSATRGGVRRAKTVSAAAAPSTARRGRDDDALRATTVAVCGAFVARGCVRPRGATSTSDGAKRACVRECVVATPARRGRDGGDGDGDTTRARKRVCVVATAVGCARKRVRDDAEVSGGRECATRVRRVLAAGGAPTPHLYGGGGILTGSGAALPSSDGGDAAPQ